MNVKFFPRNLRVFRAQLGLSQSDFGSAIGISQNTISAWESGISKPTIDNLTLLIGFGIASGVFCSSAEGAKYFLSCD